MTARPTEKNKLYLLRAVCFAALFAAVFLAVAFYGAEGSAASRFTKAYEGIFGIPDRPGIGSEFAQDIAVDAAGNAYVTGKAGPYLEITTIKYASSAVGNNVAIAASTYFGWANEDVYGNVVEVGPDGNVYVAAVASGGIHSPINGTGSDSYWTNPLILKYDSSLISRMWVSHIWENNEVNLCSNRRVIPEALAFDAQGKVYVATTFVSGCSQASGAHIKVFRLNADSTRDFFGSNQNATSSATYYSGGMGGSGYGVDSDAATGIAVAPDGSFYVSGYISNYRPGNKKKGITEDTKEDWRVVKFNADGTPNDLWNNNTDTLIDSGGDDRAEGVVVDGDGNVYVAGVIGRSSPDAEVRVVKYSAQSGDILNENVLSFPYAFVTGIAINQNRETYVDTGGGGALKYSSSLELLWRSSAWGFPVANLGKLMWSSGIAADNRGGVYIAGTEYEDSTNDMNYRTFKVQESSAPYVSVTANPTSGPVPLTSRITADVFGMQAALPQKQIGALLTKRAVAAANIAYEFDCGNGAPVTTINTDATTAASNCVFESVRTFHVTVRVTYPAGTTYPAGMIEGSVDIPVREVVIPSASVTLATVPSSGVAPLTSVVLTASPSFPAGEEPLAYTFYCYSGATGSSPQSSNTTECDYPSPGVYTPSVTVVGSSGMTASNTATVNVSASLFTVSLKAIPSFGQRPLNDVDLAATLSSPQADVVYQFDCGNGTVWRSDPIGGQSYTALNLCDYPEKGTYTARVIATNGAGRTAEGTAVVNVFTRIEPDPN